MANENLKNTFLQSLQNPKQEKNILPTDQSLAKNLGDTETKARLIYLTDTEYEEIKQIALENGFYQKKRGKVGEFEGSFSPFMKHVIATIRANNQ